MLAEGAAAERLYTEAIERLSRIHMRGSQTLARARLLYGEWLRREHRRVDAREQLRIAHAMLADMGAEGYAERARRELQATGETVRRRTVETLDELTPQEVQVARLAADGQTNPEIGAQLFLSPRTVEWHLTKVFGKLGISSRKELRSALSNVGHPPTRPAAHAHTPRARSDRATLDLGRAGGVRRDRLGMWQRHRCCGVTGFPISMTRCCSRGSRTPSLGGWESADERLTSSRGMSCMSMRSEMLRSM